MSRGLVAILVVSALAGCGYSTGSMMPGGVRRVAVQLFGNDTDYRYAEETYTRELVRQLSRIGHVTITDPEDAEALVRGRIIYLPRVTLVEDDDDQNLESSVVATVEVELVDPRSGAPLIRPFRIIRRAEQIIPRGDTLENVVGEALIEAAGDTVVWIQGQSLLEGRGPGGAAATPPR